MSSAAMTPDAGRVLISLACEAGSVREARIASERPEVARVLRGKSADEAVGLVPMVFALCGKAQGWAAAMALAAARGVETPPMLAPEIEVEVLREHLWRLMLDLPPLLGMEPRRELFAAAARAVAARDKAALVAALGDDFWNELMGALAEQEEPADTGGLLLPVMSAAHSITVWPRLTRELSRAPRWEDEPAETGAFARWQGQNPAAAAPLAARWHARSAEVWSWAAGGAKVGAGGTASAAQVAPGVGRALVETARGLLMHEITLEGDRVADYVIVAPTEWNFHRHGVLQDWLEGRPCEDRMAMRRFVASAVAALDPCVRWELEWH